MSITTDVGAPTSARVVHEDLGARAHFKTQQPTMIKAGKNANAKLGLKHVARHRNAAPETAANEFRRRRNITIAVNVGMTKALAAIVVELCHTFAFSCPRYMSFHVVILGGSDIPSMTKNVMIQAESHERTRIAEHARIPKDFNATNNVRSKTTPTRVENSVASAPVTRYAIGKNAEYEIHCPLLMRAFAIWVC